MCSDGNGYELEKIFYNILAFYQGGITHSEAENMPIPRLLKAEDHAARISEERQKAIDRARAKK